jgi:hypothetical protein
LGRSTKAKVAPSSAEPNVVDFLPGVAATRATSRGLHLGRGQRMVVTLDPMHSDEFTNMQREGFTSQLTKLDKRFL